MKRWTAAARARATGIAADTGAARVSVRRYHADADHLLQLPERLVIDGREDVINAERSGMSATSGLYVG